jgi:hypothetical protein
MPIAITCTTCAAKINAPDNSIGRKGACPKCKASFIVPDPNAVTGFEVVEEEPLIVAEVLADEPQIATPKAPTGSGIAKAAVVAGAKGKFLKPIQRNKKQVDESDYRTKVNGKPLALRAGQTAPPPIPRKSPPRE